MKKKTLILIFSSSPPCSLLSTESSGPPSSSSLTGPNPSPPRGPAPPPSEPRLRPSLRQSRSGVPPYPPDHIVLVLEVLASVLPPTSDRQIFEKDADVLDLRSPKSLSPQPVDGTHLQPYPPSSPPSRRQLRQPLRRRPVRGRAQNKAWWDGSFGMSWEHGGREKTREGGER
ncbi:putative LETM1 and EF-hand domain-containing protein 1, mitochondrial [Iris pallida]|uniref:LETM1 and EF-hand domain-containing protein 1, mitochondrial n=1 Tax=Iris pallida TaxID=29817 RepID=A0AAX6HEY3_IRIPA|nr:putative LETM1 and EF-hand domain-containing protein 1, mitochondrial [Iris pallida]